MKHDVKDLNLAQQGKQRIFWADADEVVQAVLEHLKPCKSIRQIEPAGSYRRGRETVGDLDFLVESTAADEVMDRLS